MKTDSITKMSLDTETADATALISESEQHSIVIDRATLADWNQIWPFFQQIVSARETYGLDPNWTKLDAFDQWFAPDKTVYVACKGDTVAGTYYIRPNGHGPAVHVANAGFMVNPSFQGQGIGRLMGEHALEEAKRLKYKSMQFNRVVASNQSALRLWESLGFQVIGTTPKGFNHVSQGFVDTHIMYRSLEDS
ncbi:MAG: GNAT family N-acetyltransferase [Vampirovibrio sp.]|nr:GNAT family N-acetyltransferase [Vampirovibrio sp.]